MKGSNRFNSDPTASISLFDPDVVVGGDADEVDDECESPSKVVHNRFRSLGFVTLLYRLVLEPRLASTPLLSGVDLTERSVDCCLRRRVDR